MDREPQLLLPAPHESISKRLMLLNGFLVVAVIIMFFAIYGEIHRPRDERQQVMIAVDTKAFEELSLEAKAVFVYDVVLDRALYKKNESAQLPLASLTKLMTALTAVNHFPENSKVAIQSEFLAEEGDNGLLVGESWNLNDLLDFSLIVSSNDAARSIASVIGARDLKNDNYELGRRDFISMMNDEARRLNMKQTYFINESGLDVDENVSGGYGSAEDVARLINHIMRTSPEILEATKYPSLGISSSEKRHIARNTNDIIAEIPNLIASKTGYTDLAGGNLAVVFDASVGRPIIIVVLGSSLNGRFSDMKSLVQASIVSVSQ